LRRRPPSRRRADIFLTLLLLPPDAMRHQTHADAATRALRCRCSPRYARSPIDDIRRDAIRSSLMPAAAKMITRRKDKAPLITPMRAARIRSAQRDAAARRRAMPDTAAFHCLRYFSP